MAHGGLLPLHPSQHDVEAVPAQHAQLERAGSDDEVPHCHTARPPRCVEQAVGQYPPSGNALHGDSAPVLRARYGKLLGLDVEGLAEGGGGVIGAFTAGRACPPRPLRT